MTHRRVLIIQFAVVDGDSLEYLQRIEETLFQAFSQNNFAVVDGHDFGQGVFNIFIYPKGAWMPVVERVYAFLRLRDVLDRAIIAKGLRSGRWNVIWPESYGREFHL